MSRHTTAEWLGLHEKITIGTWRARSHLRDAAGHFAKLRTLIADMARLGEEKTSGRDIADVIRECSRCLPDSELLTRMDRLELSRLVPEDFTLAASALEKITKDQRCCNEGELEALERLPEAINRAREYINFIFRDDHPQNVGFASKALACLGQIEFALKGRYDDFLHMADSEGYYERHADKSYQRHLRNERAAPTHPSPVVPQPGVEHVRDRSAGMAIILSVVLGAMMTAGELRKPPRRPPATVPQQRDEDHSIPGIITIYPQTRELPSR